MNPTIKEVKVVGELNCPHRIQTGSYYDMLSFWCECAKMPCAASNDYQMCDLDAGGECRFAHQPSLQDKGGVKKDDMV